MHYLRKCFYTHNENPYPNKCGINYKYFIWNKIDIDIIYFQ